MRNIELNKIYFLSDQFGMRFIKPIKFNKGWQNADWLIFVKYEYLDVLVNGYGDRGQQKLSYINNLLNNQRYIDDIFRGIIEVPQYVIDAFTFNDLSLLSSNDTAKLKVINSDISWPFIHVKKHISMVRMPDLSEIRDWQLDKLI